MPYANGWKKKKKVAMEYDVSAKLYDLRYREEQENKYDAILSFFRIAAGEYVLDLGCGTGLLFRRIGGKNGIVIGIDFSKRMIEEAKRACRGLDNVSLIRGDTDFLPLRDKTINKVLAITLLQNIPDTKRTILEVVRVAKDYSEIVLTWQKRIFKEKNVTESFEKDGLDIVKSIENEGLMDNVLVYRKRGS